MTAQIPDPVVGEANKAGKAIVHTQTVNEVVYNKLKNDILWGAFEPNERLRFDELRERYGVSFSSLREAISRLVSEGLVEVESHKGARVAGINATDYRDLVQVRQLIEVKCLQRAIELGDDQWEADIIGAFHLYENFLRGKGRDDLSDPVKVRVSRHNGFHTSLMKACDSPRLLNLRAVLATQAERYLTLAYRTVRVDMDELIADHERLMRAVVERRTSLACALLHEHIDVAARRLLRTLDADSPQPTPLKLADLPRETEPAE